MISCAVKRRPRYLKESTAYSVDCYNVGDFDGKERIEVDGVELGHSENNSWLLMQTMSQEELIG